MFLEGRGQAGAICLVRPLHGSGTHPYVHAYTYMYIFFTNLCTYTYCTYAYAVHIFTLGSRVEIRRYIAESAGKWGRSDSVVHFMVQEHTHTYMYVYAYIYMCTYTHIDAYIMYLHINVMYRYMYVYVYIYM
jgi:hypothetical protein